jgi:SAM-dependent methyltransferase
LNLGLLALHHFVGEKPLPSFSKYQSHFANKRGVEIGGPSKIFSANRILPVYPIAQSIDNCNFTDFAIWDAKVEPDGPYDVPGKPLGRQFICEGTDLRLFENESYDFVLSSHALEHMANPIKALHEWMRILKKGGVLLLCLPDRDKTFDHLRPATSLEHMVQDYNRGVGEDDPTHHEEVVRETDTRLQSATYPTEVWAYRNRSNLETRIMHHHVFTMESATALADYVGLRALTVSKHRPHHIVILGHKD